MNLTQKKLIQQVNKTEKMS